MKRKKIYTKLLLAGCMFLVGSALTSCDDFLTMLPTDQLPEENFWQDKADLENVRAGAYEQLTQSGQTSKILTWGELRSDNLALNTMSNTDINYLQSAILQPSSSMFDWAGFYSGINFCNLVMEQGDRMTIPNQEVDPSFTRNDYRNIRAEMLALCSLYYFYLVRAYRDVPYVTSSIRTDAQARNDLPAAQTGVAILGDCIDSLEANVNYAVENFGSDAENKGRFTRKGIHALLADMYLWRAALLKNYMQKDSPGRVNMSDVAEVGEDGTPTGVYTTVDGATVDNDYCNDLSEECLVSANEHASWVISKIKEEYDEDIQTATGNITTEQRNQPYPLYLNPTSGSMVTDNVYYQNFGAQNSLEGIFELQYDGTTTKNTTVNSYFSTYDNGTFNAATMTMAALMSQSATSVNPTVGFGKTDFRLVESCDYTASGTSKPVSKFVIRNLSVDDITDMTGAVSVSCRTADGNDAHWPVYRLTDVMLIKAEAIARSSQPSADDLREGFRLVNQIFKRCNPALVAQNSTVSGVDDELRCERLNENYADSRNAENLLDLLYRERQREFVGEGKRWFDIVRQVEFSNDPQETLSTFASYTSAVSNRLSRLYAFYNPIYSEELKVNGVDNGGYLTQNPVWDRYTKN